jgi:hypothetical protein
MNGCRQFVRNLGVAERWLFSFLSIIRPLRPRWDAPSWRTRVMHGADGLAIAVLAGAP